MVSHRKIILLDNISNANWEGYVDDRKSTSGCASFLGNCLVPWLSKKQSSISLSTTKVEYVVATT